MVDGDTLDVRVALGYDVFVKLRIRLYGVDTPEKYGVKKGSEEYEAGVRASLFTSTWVKDNAGNIEVCGNHGTGKYGRWILELCAGEESLGTQLIESGNAEPY